MVSACVRVLLPSPLHSSVTWFQAAFPFSGACPYCNDGCLTKYTGYRSSADTCRNSTCPGRLGMDWVAVLISRRVRPRNVPVPKKCDSTPSPASRSSEIGSGAGNCTISLNGLDSLSQCDRKKQVLTSAIPALGRNRACQISGSYHSVCKSQLYRPSGANSRLHSDQVHPEETFPDPQSCLKKRSAAGLKLRLAHTCSLIRRSYVH